jgi:hypothetical protein
MHLSILKIIDATDPGRDTLRAVAGISPGDIEEFMGIVAVHMAGLLNLPVSCVRARLSFDLGDAVDCRSIGGPGIAGRAELRAFANYLAGQLVRMDAFPDLARSAA